MSTQATIEVNALAKTYRSGMFGRRNVEALKGVSFQVGRGEVFGLLGPNGAGKTTLVKVLLGIVRGSGGEASLLGRPVGDRRSRQRVGYLPENHRFAEHHTGNTALEFFGSLSGLPQREIRRRAPELLDVVGLSDWDRTPIKQYSKGMQQRLGMAQAMMHDPDVLILDEPTDGVDPVGRKQMRVLLEGLREQGKTIFINSHLLQEVELVCDRIVILNRGLMQREGRVDELTRATTAEFNFLLKSPEEQVRAALGTRRIDALQDAGGGHLSVTLGFADQGEVDACVDALRAAGISIVSMSGKQRTLEDAFLEVIDEVEVVS